MDDPQKPGRRSGMLMMLILLLLAGVLIGWAYLRNPPGTAGGVAAPSAPAGAADQVGR